VDLPEITGIDLSSLNHQEIVNLLPTYGGRHPTKAILLDKQTGKAYGIASGWEEDTIVYNSLTFKSGAITPDVAARAGRPWVQLGNHTEAVAAAFMRKQGIIQAIVYINGSNPCWGSSTAPGCYYQLSKFLAEGSRMSVYNKFGADFVSSWPDRKFHFTGSPD
jgi:hypothetical protein